MITNLIWKFSFYSPVFTSFAHERPYINAQAYMFPYGVNAIGVTTTKYGIATREFLCKRYYLIKI